MNCTVLGATGFIGGRLVTELGRLGHECWAPERDARDLLQRDLGCVFYCIGLTADFRTRPFDTVQAHVMVLSDVLERASFDRLIYLSSTRVYSRACSADEAQDTPVASHRPDDLYNLSKLMGESLTLTAGRDSAVVRLSNIVGPGMGQDNFLGALLHEARQTGEVRFQTAATSEKDYLWVDDAVAGIAAVAEQGSATIYNLAAGANVNNAQIAALFEAREIQTSFLPDAPETVFPQISVDRVVRDTGWRPGPVLPHLAETIRSGLEG